MLLLTGMANGELIFDVPAGNWSGRLNGNPNDGGLIINESPSVRWPAQRFIIDKPTSITQMDAFTRRRVGTQNPHLVIYTDAPNPKDFDRNDPKDRLYSTELPIPLGEDGDFEWHSTGALSDPFELEQGAYWLAITSESDEEGFQFIGEVGNTNDPPIEDRSVANYENREIVVDGAVVGMELRWTSILSPTHLSVRIHGEAVPEPATASLALTGLLISAMGIRWSKQCHSRKTGIQNPTALVLRQSRHPKHV